MHYIDSEHVAKRREEIDPAAPAACPVTKTWRPLRAKHIELLSGGHESTAIEIYPEPFQL
jgi:hypothetical protein